MPRNGRGGSRQGAAGKTYANRSDLNTAAKKLPVTTVPGQQYGAASQQAAAQAMTPMASGPLNAPGAGGPPAPPGASQAGGPPPVTGLPPGLPPPGSLPPLDAPTDQPNTPLMNGVDAGAGQGSEALAPMIVHPLVAAAGILNSLGSAASPQVKTIRDVLNAQMANQAAP